MKQFDILIVGAGMVGAAAACALAKRGFSVAVVEARAPKPYEANQPFDLRVSALSVASELLLDELGAWSHIQGMRLAPYDTLATWEWTHSEVSFEASGLGYQHLGHIVENRVVQLGLWQAMEQHDNITLFCGHAPKRLWQDSDGAYLQLDEQVLSGRLMLGCDGAGSKVRQQAGIGVTGWQYRQHCMVVSITTQKPQQSMTWQQFTPAGPRSFLPLPGQNGSLVWYDAPERIAQLVKMSKAELKQEILQHFPERLGEFEVVAQASFPLTRQHAQSYFQGRMVLLGDAAHTINPLAGQGVNLGFKDVAALAEVLDAAQRDDSWDSEAILAKYQRSRRKDNLLMQSTMDLFYTLFSNQSKPLAVLRNVGLMAAERAGPLKQRALRYAMGL